MMLTSLRSRLFLSSALAGLVLPIGVVDQSHAVCFQLTAPEGEVLTCSGELSGTGVANGVIAAPTDVDILIVGNLAGPITPGEGDTGIVFGRISGDMRKITINSDADIMSSENSTNGIFAESGGGPISIENKGNISVSTVGIEASGSIDGETSVTNYGTVEGGTTGISITRGPDRRTERPADEVGDVTITTKSTSDVRGGDSAIDVDFGSGAVGAITVTTEGVIRSGRIGINAQHSGSGVISVRSDATINSSGTGIVAAHSAGDGEVSVTSNGRINSNGVGLFGLHLGAGDLNVTNNGVVASDSVGLTVSHSGAGKITVASTGDIVSGATGLRGSHTGAGDIEATVTGAIEAGTDGVALSHAGAGNITLISTDTILSGSDGLSAFHFGSGQIDIETSGDIDAGDDGIEVQQSGYGTVIVTSSGNIKAANDGIRIQFSDATSETESSVVLEGGLVEGGSEGIEFVGAGAVGDQANVLTISGTQTISGGNHDVLGGIGNELIDNRGELTSLGTIDLGGGANRFENRAGSLFNSGDIVDLGAGNPFINAGRLSPFGFGTMGTTAITGNWVGEVGGVLEIDTVLNDGTVDETDVLAIEGNTSGTTLVMVNNLDGEGGQTGQGPTDGIKITDISGASDGNFELVGGFVQAGAFEYGLFQADGQDWYLQTESLSDPAIMAPYIAYSLQTFGLKITGTFNERTGTRIGWRPDIMDTSRFSSSADLLSSSLQEPVFEDVVEEASTRFGAWARIIGAWSDADGSLAGGFADVSYDETQWATQAGFDAIISEADNSTLVASAFLHYGQISTNSTNRSTGRAAGSIKTDAWGGGGSLTYATTGGLYLDGVATYTHYDLGVTAGTGAVSSTDGDGWTVSGEAGWRIALADQIAMTPQAQLVYQDISLGSTTDSTGVLTTFSNAESLEGRLGTTLEFVPVLNGNSIRLYAEANIVHEFLNDPVATVAGTPLALGFDDTGYEVGVGAQFGQNGGGFAAWVEGDYRAPFDANDGIDTWSATGGVALRF